MGTSLSWGAGVTLRSLLVVWVLVALGITSNAMPTYLNAMVAVRTVLGAGATAKLVTLETVLCCMPVGVLIGIVVMAFAVQQPLLLALGLLLLLGVSSGSPVTSLNTLLQGRGKHSVEAGNTIAVQNLGESVVTLLMPGLYSLAVSVGVLSIVVGIGFDVVFTMAIVVLWVQGQRK